MTSVFAKPISSTEPQCTPEPAGRLIYGTAEPFDPGRALDVKGRGLPGNPAYIPANMRNKDMLTGQFQAGASNDLCFGFTLTPNMEAGVVRTSPTGTAGFRIQEDPPVPDRAGTHAWTAGTDEDLEDAIIELPAGFAGDPDSLPSCTEEQFGLTNYLDVGCPANTVAGTVYARLTTDLRFDGGSVRTHLATGGFPNPTGSLSDGGIVYNLPHGPNELARLGVAIRPVDNILPTKFVVKLALTPTGRVSTVVEGAPKVAYYFDPAFPEDTLTPEGQLLPGVIPSPLYLEALAIRAWGSATGHPTLSKDFAEWGTDCSTPAKASMTVKTSLGNESSMDSNAFTMTGCESLPFLPAVDVTTTEKRPGVPTATNVKVTLGQTTSGPRAALLKNAEVTLPPGLEIGAQVASGANGLPLCTAAQFAKDSGAANTCPAGSKAGDVTIITPLQSRPFVGSAYLGEQSAIGELPPLYLELAPEGATAADAPRIKLTGSV
ncbi:MAG: hypothetical protein JHD16_19225, partial [Solirubrobacteraceae bacterium]|nr:hypothetical protein [Solirubrobacteraceae bacterium]